MGDLGEDIATKYLTDKRYVVLQRNYLRKWGELDIVAKYKGILYFIEVKTMAINYFINRGEWHRPEDNLHRMKMTRIKRAIQSYLAENRLSIETEWEFSAITVIIKRKTGELYKIEHLENLII